MWCRIVRHTLAISWLGVVQPSLAAGIAVEGDVDCGIWVKARTEGQSAILEGYVLGLMNGLALASQIEFWQATGVPVGREQVFLWMDNYCRANPLSRTAVGAVALMIEHTGDRFRQSIAK